MGHEGLLNSSMVWNFGAEGVVQGMKDGLRELMCLLNP